MLIYFILFFWQHFTLIASLKPATILELDVISKDEQITTGVEDVSETEKFTLQNITEEKSEAEEATIKIEQEAIAEEATIKIEQEAIAEEARIKAEKEATAEQERIKAEQEKNETEAPRSLIEKNETEAPNNTTKNIICDEIEILNRQNYVLNASKFNEISLLSISSQKVDGEEVMWFGNDGDDGIIAAATISGRLIRQYRYNITDDGDSETLSLGPCSTSGSETCLYIGVLGNNAAQRCKNRSCSLGKQYNYILKIIEPDISVDCADFTLLDGVTIVVDYNIEDSPVNRADCEAMFVDFTGDEVSGNPGDIYIVTKLRPYTELIRAYYIPISAHENASVGSILDDVVMEIVASPRIMVWTGADMSRQGDLIFGRSGTNNYLWTRGANVIVGEALEEDYCNKFGIPPDRGENDNQFETVAFMPDGKSYVEISECPRGNEGRLCNPNIWITRLRVPISYT